MIGNLPNMTLHVFLYLVPGDESFATQSTLIWILTSMTIHVSQGNFGSHGNGPIKNVKMLKLGL